MTSTHKEITMMIASPFYLFILVAFTWISTLVYLVLAIMAIVFLSKISGNLSSIDATLKQLLDRDKNKE